MIRLTNYICFIVNMHGYIMKLLENMDYVLSFVKFYIYLFDIIPEINFQTSLRHFNLDVSFNLN